VARTRDWRGKLGFENERERERERERESERERERERERRRQTCERGNAEEDSKLFFYSISFSTCGSA
jgi:hypothetical protein